MAQARAKQFEESPAFEVFLESEVARRTAELRESERFAQATVDALSASLSILDENGTIIAVNRTWRRFAEAGGVAAENVSEGINYLAVCDAAIGLGADSAAEMAGGIRSVLQGARAEFTMEYFCEGPTGGQWFIGRVTRFPGEGPLRIEITHDEITERKLGQLQNERLLREQTRFLQVLEQTADSLVITDLSGDIEYVNQAYQNHSGYTREELVGQNARILQSGRTPPESYAALWEALSHGRTWQGEFYNRRKDGSEYIEFASISAACDAAGNITHYVGAKTDITLRKQREEELRQALEAAEAASVAKTHFLATMSHEIRTPMNAIIGMAQVLQMPDVTAAERHDYSRAILDSGQLLMVLLNDILDLSKLEVGKIEIEAAAMEPGRIIGEVQALYTAIAGRKGLRIENVWIGPPRRYLGDPHRLQQMLSNLVSNAIKFTAQGQIHIEASEVARDEHTAVLEFSVTDSGIGIAEHEHARLFQSFSQADSSISRRYGGSGLGLSLVSNFARLMGGEVGVDSEVGRGSRFWFRIRAKLATDAADSRPAQWPSAAVALSDPVATQLAGRVLVVEDDPSNQKVVEILLRKLGLSMLLAEDGQQALDVITRGDTAELILMDVQTPRLDGYAATAAIRHWEQETGAPRRPIIALTADAFEEDRQRCLAAGMDAVLTKPVVFHALQAQLAKWLPLAVPASAAPLVADQPVDVARVTALMDELLPLLAKNKFNAIGRFRDLQDAVAGTFVAAEINEAGRLLGDLEFELTLQHLRRIATTHAWSNSA